MSKGLRPLLAAKIESLDQLGQLRYPLFGSAKIDGIRLRIDPTLGAVSRTHKPIPNKHIQEIVKDNPWLKYLDGEAVIDDPTSPKIFNRTQSALMTSSGQPAFHYYVFDWWFDPDKPFMARHELANRIVEERQEVFNAIPNQSIQIVPQLTIANVADAIKFEAEQNELGFEGIMLRGINDPYKNGRSTLKQQILMKMKRVQDDEAKIVGFEPLMRNDNEQQRDVFGYAKRSSHKANKRADEMVGKLIVEHPMYGQFSIGSGLDAETRQEMYNNWDKYRGQIVTYTFVPYGTLDKPRHPIFKGIRYD